MVVCLVTGASRGIGKEICTRLSADGHYVIGTATTIKGSELISSRLGCNGQGRVLDVTDEAEIKNLAKYLSSENLSPLIMVSNAGITRDNLLIRMSIQEWRNVLETNLTASFSLASAFVRPMTRAKFGRIVHVSSVVAHLGNAGQTNYAASKSGIEGLTKSLARELAGRSITVNSVAPGFIDTEMTQTLPESNRQKLIQQIPLKRLGTQSEVASAVSYLVSKDAGYITGSTIHVNGGMYMS